MKNIAKKIIFLFIVLMITVKVNASTLIDNKYTSMNLEETIKSEEIKLSTKHNPSDDAINIYMFRGNGCIHCRDFLSFLNNHISDYGYMFNLVSFEIFYDENNNSLFEKMGEFMQDSVRGVPYIIIGGQTFLGYSTKMDEELLTTIVDEYNTDERYDALSEYLENGKTFEEKYGTSNKIKEKNEKKEDENNSISDDESKYNIKLIICIMIVVIICLIYVIRKLKK